MRAVLQLHCSRNQMFRAHWKKIRGTLVTRLQSSANCLMSSCYLDTIYQCDRRKDTTPQHIHQSITQSMTVYLRVGFYNKKIQNQWHGYVTLR